MAGDYFLDAGYYLLDGSREYPMTFGCFGVLPHGYLLVSCWCQDVCW